MTNMARRGRPRAFRGGRGRHYDSPQTSQHLVEEDPPKPLVAGDIVQGVSAMCSGGSVVVKQEQIDAGEKDDRQPLSTSPSETAVKVEPKTDPPVTPPNIRTTRSNTNSPLVAPSDCLTTRAKRNTNAPPVAQTARVTPVKPKTNVPAMPKSVSSNDPKPSKLTQKVAPTGIVTSTLGNPSTSSSLVPRTVSATQAKPSTDAPQGAQNVVPTPVKSENDDLQVRPSVGTTCASPSIDTPPMSPRASSETEPPFVDQPSNDAEQVARTVSSAVEKINPSSEVVTLISDLVTVSPTSEIEDEEISVVEFVGPNARAAPRPPEDRNEIPVVVYAGPALATTVSRRISSTNTNNEDTELPVILYDTLEIRPRPSSAKSESDDEALMIVYEGPPVQPSTSATKTSSSSANNTQLTTTVNSTATNVNVRTTSPEELSCLTAPRIKAETLRDGPSQNMDTTVNGDDVQNQNGTSLKRPLPAQGFEGSSKRTRYSRPKTAIQRLNDIVKNLTYVVDCQEGPDDNPTFVVSVRIYGQLYIGRGSTKVEAQLAAANVALSMVPQFPPKDIPAQQVAPSSSRNVCDSTSSCVDDKKPFHQCNGVPGTATNSGTPQCLHIRNGLEFATPMEVLRRLCPNAQYSVKRNTNGPHSVTVRINDLTFVGFGRKIVLAKSAAAREALSKLYGHTLCSLSSIADMPADGSGLEFLPNSLTNAISRAVFQKFQELVGNDPEHRKWKTLAAIVMTTNMLNPVVVAVSTGTRCIDEKCVTTDGTALNDCHAEIISQRCFKDFLYRQLESCVGRDCNNSVLQLSSEYIARMGTNYHLFLTNAPCGDAHIFSHREQFEAIDRHPSDQMRGLLRSKIECGEGTIPVNNTQTPGGSKKPVIMSCSDKLLRWNFCGIQGCLLSYFVKPVFLKSVVIANVFNPGAVRRAMYGRIESSLTNLPHSYRINRPQLKTTHHKKAAELAKSPNFSVNWTLGMPSPEIVNGKTGKLLNGDESRLSRHNFALRFASLYRRMIPGIKHTQLEKRVHPYSRMKSRNVNYQKAKAAVNNALRAANLGQWSNNPAAHSDLQSMV